MGDDSVWPNRIKIVLRDSLFWSIILACYTIKLIMATIGDISEFLIITICTAVELCSSLGLVNKTWSMYPASQLVLHSSVGYATNTT